MMALSPLQEVKHTRNIIAAHMKMVHLISWKEYQEILIKIRLGENVGDLPAPDLFEVKKDSIACITLYFTNNMTFTVCHLRGEREI